MLRMLQGNNKAERSDFFLELYLMWCRKIWACGSALPSYPFLVPEAGWIQGRNSCAVMWHFNGLKQLISLLLLHCVKFLWTALLRMQAGAAWVRGRNHKLVVTEKGCWWSQMPQNLLERIRITLCRLLTSLTDLIEDNKKRLEKNMYINQTINGISVNSLH